MMLSAPDILNASILIVDDQEANVKLLERLLGDAGYANVASTRLPQEVSSLHRKHHCDLILLDLQMPGMDGFEVTEANGGGATGWNESERVLLQAKIAAREPFLDFAFSRVNADGSEQQFRVSGEPMFNDSSRFTGYRGVGVEVTAKS